MRALLDTCVLSELRKADGNSGVHRAVQRIPDDNLFVSVISIGEITKGVELLEDGKRKLALRNWLQTLERDYISRIIPIDPETAHIWGELTAVARKRGRTVASSDGLIAATARRHGLHIMTRNTKDFEATGAVLINPWE